MTVRLSRAFPGGPYPEDRPLAHRHRQLRQMNTYP